MLTDRWAFPGGSEVKNPPFNAGDTVSIPGQEDSLGMEMATHSSILAWEIPQTDESMEWQKRWTQLHD